jgi:hypothetical protein
MRVKGKKIILMIVILLVNTLLLISCIIAWFISSKEATSSGFEGTSTNGGVDLTGNVYKYDILNEEIIRQDISSPLRINNYDLLFEAQNDFNPLIIEFDLSGGKLLDGGGTLKVTIERNTQIPTISNNLLTNYSSNIMCLSALSNATNLTINKNTYMDTVALFNLRPKVNFFETLTLESSTRIETQTKKDSISFFITYPSGDYHIDNPDTVKVYLLLSYDTYNTYSYTGGSSSLTKFYIDSHDVQSSTNEQDISILNDITRVRIELVE